MNEIGKNISPALIASNHLNGRDDTKNDMLLRGTAWERPCEEYGWGNNRSLILMKSYDLINWTYGDLYAFVMAFIRKYN